MTKPRDCKGGTSRIPLEFQGGIRGWRRLTKDVYANEGFYSSSSLLRKKKHLWLQIYAYTAKSCQSHFVISQNLSEPPSLSMSSLNLLFIPIAFVIGSWYMRSRPPTKLVPGQSVYDSLPSTPGSAPPSATGALLERTPINSPSCEN